MKQLFTALLLLMTASLMAQTISVQGVLRDRKERALDDGFYSVDFKIYENATGGSALWTDTYPSLELRNGVFQVNLGENASIATLPFDMTYYIGIAVEGNTEMNPRLQLTTFPYALAINGATNKFPSTGNVIVGQDSLIINQGDLVLDEGVLSLEGGNSRIVFNDGTSLNTAAFGGPAGSVSNPSGVSINADADGSGAGGIQLQVNGQTQVEINQNGFTSLGSSAPKIKQKLFTGSLSSSSTGFVTVPLGMTADKIVGWSYIQAANGSGRPDTWQTAFTEADARVNGYLRIYFFSTSFYLQNINNTSYPGREFKLLITYIE